ncbi:hypothetical protein [Paucibacter sp. KBW04]|uniref:hypothetical protein n=1 Tax=Paucibacter sp. KBW04 TaxID=2153361 RepID=UPI000F57D112|nr:hypothetical protein [Paucibacter sp. KBW04]
MISRFRRLFFFSKASDFSAAAWPTRLSPSGRSRSAYSFCLLALPALMTACGGGGGGSAPDVPTPTPIPLEPPALSSRCEPGSVARLALEAAPQQGRNTELSLLACGAAGLSSLKWTQTAGPALNNLSRRAQAISVEPAAAGPYRFDLSYVDGQGRSFVAPVQFSAAPASEALQLVLRGEPSALSGTKLSLRAWLPQLTPAELAQATVSWSQTAGPTVDLSNGGSSSSLRLVLSAPVVSSDSIVTLSASLSLPDGRRASGQFNLLVQAPGSVPSDPLFSGSDAASRVYPYLAQGPYATALRDCIYSPTLSRSNLCTLNRLPILGQQTAGAAPTVEQVMQRVLVSNDWMAEVFERFLREQDVHGDFRRMLSAVTAVVIGGQVRPAFYWNATGAIYLDASYLWLTPEQRDTLSEAPDPRSANGQSLQYATPWRYVKNNQHAVTSYAVLQRQSRGLDELPNELGRLLYHELTHAGDFLPPAVQASLDGAKRVYEASPALTPSQDLFNRLPFYSSTMQGLARVLSFGEAPSLLQNSYTPSDITYFFSNDRVNDDYSYSVPSGAAFSREDAAMLVEEAMMQLRYGVLRDYAITNQLAVGASSADLLVNWGQRGRIGEPAIRPRLQLVLNQLMPWLPPNFSANLAPPLALRAGQTWGANLDQAALAAGLSRALSSQQRFNEEEQTSRVLRSR